MSIITCYADTETTGLSPSKGDRIVEISLVLAIDFEPVDTFHSYINPEIPVGFSTHIHGYTDEFLADKPKFQDISRQLKEFSKQSDTFIAYNSPFDMRFLQHEFHSRGFGPFKFENQIDVLQLARKVYPKQKNQLKLVCERLGIDLSERKLHTAVDDTLLTIEVHKKLLEIINNTSCL